MVDKEPLAVHGAYIVRVKRFHDQRGFFEELYHKDKYQELEHAWKQVNWSWSNKGALRGLHCSPYPKLISCVSGKLRDFMVDLRKDSPTFGKSTSIDLSAEEGGEIFVPAGCAHGIYAWEDKTALLYLQGGMFVPALEIPLCFFDPKNGLDLPFEDQSVYLMTEKDRTSYSFDECAKVVAELEASGKVSYPL
eukprot:TRINITY_DN3460_c0_g1_i1.p1 TRINITY_DN3460_c0_g1~~TRINITY_DN3460_c0_g1_i1.p1  ORF type:complete len:192 (-),score=25.34 TRINITY_DN3460_c0_g1_i1:180-755(-)